MSKRWTSWLLALAMVLTLLPVGALPVYAAAEYTVTFYMNDGTSNVYDRRPTESQRVTKPTVDPARTGYTFTKWYTNPACAPSQEFLFDSSGNSVKKLDMNLSLYAGWEADTYNVTFNTNGGKWSNGSTNDKIVPTKYNEAVVMPENPQRDGYVFTGWNTAQAGSGTWWNASTRVTKAETLYAQWRAQTLTVTFDLQGGSLSGVRAQTVSYGSTVSKPNGTPTRLGHTFDNWYWKDPADSEEKLWKFDGDQQGANRVTADTTIYAKWIPNKCTVTFNWNTGAGNNDLREDEVDYETPVEKPADPTRDGYSFGGWYTDNNFTTEWDFANKVTGDITLYAKWGHQVTFYDMDKTTRLDSLSQTVTTGTMATEPSESERPTHTGYKFVGWFSDPNYETQWIFAGNKVTADVALYGKWEKEKYTVTFQLNGGTWNDQAFDQTQELEYGDEIIRPANPTKANNAFLRWCSDEKLTKPWNFSTDTVKGTTNLYAAWDPNVFVVTYYPSGGTGEVHTESVNKAAEGNTSVTVKAPADTALGYTRAGCEFKGWNTQENGKGTTYQPGATIPKLTGDLELYAQWERTSILVTLDANDNSGRTKVLQAPIQPDGTIGSVKLECDWTNSGLAITGWNTLKSGKGNFIKYGDDYTPLAEITLYAQWSSDSYSVIYDANGGIDPNDTSEETDEEETAASVQIVRYVKKTDGKVTLLDNPFTRVGFSFTGWNSEADGSGTANKPGDKLTLKGDLKLYAQWKQNFCTVSFDTRGGSKLESVQIAYGSKLTLPKDPTREDLTFDGWYKDEECTDLWDFGNDTVKQNITLYARWRKLDVTVKFNPNGGMGKMEDQTFQYDKLQALNANEFARTGCTFWYWNTEPDGSGTDYENGQKIKLEEDITLYAIWNPGVTFHANNGSADKVVQSIPKKTTAALRGNTFTRTGYNFSGWNTEPNGTGDTYNDKKSVSLSASMDLYAVWTPHKYTVRFNSNGGSGVMSAVQLEYDKAQALPANAFSRTGKTFQGWARTAGGKVEYKNKESIKNLTDKDGGTIILYAVWDAAQATSGTGSNGTGSRDGTIWIQKGNDVYDSMTPAEGDPYSFLVSSGVYNVVVTSGDLTVTKLVVVEDGEVKGTSVISPQSASSVLEVRDGAPNVVVGNLDVAAEDNRVLGALAELRLIVTGKASDAGSAEQNAIRALCPSDKALEFIDFTLKKLVDGKEDATFSAECNENLVLYVPFEKSATKDITVYRWHNGRVDTLTTRSQSGEYIEVQDDMVILHVRRFCTYAISYTPKEPEITYLSCLRNHTCPINTFDDANPTSWYHDGVHWALDIGAMNGVTARRFYPGNPTTRAQLVTILWRLEGSPRVSLPAPFDDVAETSWCAGAIAWASARGIVEGVSAKRFNPNGTLTREQLATILYRYIQMRTYVDNMETVGIDDFADAASVSAWAREGMNWLTSYGILDGVATSNGGRLLAPKESATRAQVATVMMRYWNGFVD